MSYEGPSFRNRESHTTNYFSLKRVPTGIYFAKRHVGGTSGYFGDLRLIYRPKYPARKSHLLWILGVMQPKDGPDARSLVGPVTRLATSDVIQRSRYYGEAHFPCKSAHQPPGVGDLGPWEGPNITGRGSPRKGCYLPDASRYAGMRGNFWPRGVYS